MMSHIGRAGWLASGLLAGCFSSEDFSACTQVGSPCGADLVCVAAGRCEPTQAPDAEAVDLGPQQDAQARPPLEIINEIPEFVDAEGRDVRILTGQLAGRNVRIINARTIEITRAIDASGRGSPGGAGGGGGGAGTRGGVTEAGQAGSATANAGSGGAEQGGNGGQGSPGSRPGNAPGGRGGTLDMPDGEAGADAVFGGTCADADYTTARPGHGGGGGGGGRGGPAVESLCIGRGGGGGGAGGPGGGFLVFEASELITVRGVLSARGAPAPTEGAALAGGACATCGECAADAGRGGDGSAEAGPGAGDVQNGVGAGGLGGGGSGGMVLLQAPTLKFDPNTAIDVTGVGPAGGGLIGLYGQRVGTPLLEGFGAGLSCAADDF